MSSLRTGEMVSCNSTERQPHDINGDPGKPGPLACCLALMPGQVKAHEC